jgi:glycosyltransferase involved in cell wall biosynthesis
LADQPLRVLFVVGETTGGIGRHVRALAAGLLSHGVTSIVCGPESALTAVAGVPGVEVHRAPVGDRAGVALSSARRAVRHLARDADVVHGHGLAAGVAATARPAGRPLVVTWHNAPLVTGMSRRLHLMASRYVARRADVVLGASPDLTQAARIAGARDARDIFVASPPSGPPARSREEVRAALGVEDRPMVLAVGRLQAQKRFDVLVGAAAGWTGPSDPVVVIAGSGPDEDELRMQAATARADVRLLGERADVADLIPAADLVALPSAWEARALVAQETLRAGVPLVTTAVGGLPDLVADAALAVPVGDSAALRDAIRRLLADPTLRADLVERGLARAAQWPTLEQSVADLAVLYRSLPGIQPGSGTASSSA